MRNTGFTLLELAIVLVIVSLLVGSIMVGNSVVETARLQRVIGEYNVYSNAIKEFQDKYYALPGDMNTAEDVWDSDSGCPTTATNTIPKTVTCNGDGNGHIGDSTDAGVLSVPQEWWRAWQQLANAGLIDGKFTGARGVATTSTAIIGSNVPASNVRGAGWTLNYYQLTADGALWADQYGHLMHLGAAVASSYTYGAVLKPIQALEIDSKVDDGKPGQGKIRAWRTSILPDCTTNDTTQSNQAYNVAVVTKECSLIFLLGF